MTLTTTSRGRGDVRALTGRPTWWIAVVVVLGAAGFFLIRSRARADDME